MTAMERRAATAAERRLQHEYEEVEAAIALVRSGAAASVSLAGLGYGRALLERLGRTARDAGVLLEPIWAPEDESCDLVIRRADG